MSKITNIMPVALIGNYHPVFDSLAVPPVRHRFLLQFFPSVILSTVIQNKGNHLISGTINAGVFLPRMTDVRTWDMALKAVVAGNLKGNESALVVNNS